jgi:general stress protein YciG
MTTTKHGSSERGFGAMDKDKQRDIASKGGKSVPAEERSFSKDHELASEAGRKGGHASGGNFANEPERAAGAGKKGGEHSHGGTHEQHVKAGQQSHKNK